MSVIGRDVYLFLVGIFLLLLLIMSSPVCADTQAQVTLYIHDSSIYGPLLPGVQVIGHDGAGNMFNEVTDAGGKVVLTGNSGSWYFEIVKPGYTQNPWGEMITSDVIRDGYMIPVVPDQVQVTLYVHDSSISGPLLPGVQVIGHDGAGYMFNEVTDAGGEVVLTGNSGSWYFEIVKPGYTQNPWGEMITSDVIRDGYMIPVIPDQVQLSLYVHEGSESGPALQGVLIIGTDGAGNPFSGTSDSSGCIVFNGAPGTWSFTASKSGYDTEIWTNTITSSQRRDPFLQISSATPVQLTLYVHEGSESGPALQGVLITGTDGAGNPFSGTSDSSGRIIFNGAPGTWSFTASKSGYDTEIWTNPISSSQRRDPFLQITPIGPFSPGWKFHADLLNSGIYDNGGIQPNNNLKWSNTGYGAFESPSIANGIIYVGTEDGHLYAYDADTGAQRWMINSGTVRSTPAILGTNLFFTSCDRKLYAVKAETGKEVWNFTTGGMVVSSPAIDNERVFFGTSYPDGRIYAVSSLTGELIWSVKGGDFVHSSPALMGDKVYFLTGNYSDVSSSPLGNIIALDVSTGTEQWRFVTNHNVYSSPTISEGILYAGAGLQRYAINAENGNLIWSTAPPFGANIESTPTVVGNRVYYGDASGKIFSLDAATGSVIWTYTTGNSVSSSPAYADGIIYVGSGDTKVYALDAETGIKIWDFTTDGPVTSSPLVWSGTVYVGSGIGLANGKTFYAIGDHSSVPEPTIQPPPTILGPGEPTSPGPVLDTLTPEFHWPEVSGADGYGLYIRDLDTNTLVFDSRSLGISITGTRYLLPSGILENGKKYRWNMNPHSPSGWGSYSERLYFQAPAPQSLLPPPMLISPGGLSSSTSELVTLTPTFIWQAVPGADGYGLYISDITNGEENADLIFNSQSRGIRITGTQYTLPPNILHNGKKYRWNMNTHDASGWGIPNTDRFYIHTQIIEQSTIPVADFTINPPSPIADWPVVLDASESYSPNGGIITRYIWRIDNGMKFESFAPIRYYKFQNIGSHQIELTVIDENNVKSDPVTKTITVIRSADALSVRLTAPEKMSSWQSEEFQIDVTNNENREISQVFVKMEFPSDEFSLGVFITKADGVSIFYDEDKDPDTVFYFIENIPAKSGIQIRPVLTKKFFSHDSSGIIRVTVKETSKLQNKFYPGIGWKPSSDDNGKSGRDRLSKAYDLDAELVKSYFETNEDISLWDSATLKSLRKVFDLNGAIHVYLAYSGIYTDKNYVDVSYQDGEYIDGHYNIVFSHSGGTQTLYQKLKSGKVTANYAVFVAPALLDPSNLTQIIKDGNVKKIFIVQSSEDILYWTHILFEKDHEFSLGPQVSNKHHGVNIQSPVNTNWIGISQLLENINLEKLPASDDFWIGGADRYNRILFEDMSVDTGKPDDDQTIDIITINKMYDPLSTINFFHTNKVHNLLLIDIIEAYNHDQYPFDGTYPGLQKVPLPKTQLDSAVVCYGFAHDPNEKYGPEGHHPANEPLNYTIEYENEGDGSAFGVYVIDTLDPSLDDSTLEISPMYSVATGQQITERGTYFPENRTVYWDVGTVAPGEGGYANISVKFLPSVPDGTYVINSATVYFPSAFEETQTNSIVTIKGVNLPPEVPNLIYPENYERGLPINGTLFWEGYDPNNETLVYDVYLGTSSFPPLVLENTTYDLYYYSELANDAIYYWKVVAKDPYDGVTSSDIHQFTTMLNVTPPIANFTANTTLGQLPFVVQFTDTSTGNITSHHWSFGDGTFAENVTEVTHTYTQSGNYTVTLTVSGPDGGDTSSQVIQVLPPQCTLFGNATIFGNPAPVGSLVTASAAGFNQSVIIEQEGWYGEAESGKGLVLQGDIPTGSPITFTVNGSPAWFGLLDEYGNTAWLGTRFPFFPNSVLHVNLDVPTTLTADFSASQTTDTMPFDVIFTDLSEGDPFIWIWDFGDGSNVTTELNSTHHVYANPGVYTVHLTVKRGAAKSELMKNGYITVTYPPSVADFTTNTTSGQAPLHIQFTDNSTGSITSRHWSFGDGTFAENVTEVTHTYTTPGNYTVTLTVSGPDGEDSASQDILVIDDTIAKEFLVQLNGGWNIFSTPVKLEPGKSTFGEIFSPTEQQKIQVVLGWDEGYWFIPGPSTHVDPLYAYFIKIEDDTTATAVLVPSETVTALPSRQMTEGINLIGPAPAYDENSQVFQTMPIDQGLVSIEHVGDLTGYVIVVSPNLNQPGWAYAKGGQVKDLLPFKGYWVTMENGPDTMYGFSTTPILY